MKKRILFVGDIIKNNGPSNVNKELYKYLKDDFIFLTCSNKVQLIFQLIINTIIADGVIYSGLLKVSKISLIIARLLGKKIIYIMHGCVQYEQGEVGGTNTLGGDILENQLFRASRLILCVSAPFSDWFREYRPEWSDKVGALTNGVPWEKLIQKKNNENRKKVPNQIVLLGGGRKTKCNLNVVNAVEKLNREKNLELRICLYGYKREDDDSIEIIKSPTVDFKGMVSHEELMKKFSESGLFVQNSMFEPFGLACIEALMNECDILISKHVGCGSVLELKQSDVIEDPYDVCEIAEKIEKVINENNAQRLLNSIDRDVTSCEASAKRLKDIVNEII